jgi:hypothetical protein
LLGPGLFSFVIFFFTQMVELLEEWSARRKTATYTQDNTTWDLLLYSGDRLLNSCET